MTKADQLWEKYADLQQDQGAGPCTWSMRYDQFLAALQEHGEAVRAEAVKVCHTMSHRNDDMGAIIAAAIEKMKLP